MSDDNTTTVDLEPLHLDLIAIAMDRLACETDVDSPLADIVMSLFSFFDELADEANEPEAVGHVVSRDDNLIVVNFSPKED